MLSLKKAFPPLLPESQRSVRVNDGTKRKRVLGKINLAKNKKLPFATFHVSRFDGQAHAVCRLCTAMHFPHATTNSRMLTPCSFSLSPAGELGFVIEAATVYVYSQFHNPLSQWRL